MNYLNTRSRGHSRDVDELTNKLARQMSVLKELILATGMLS